MNEFRSAVAIDLRDLIHDEPCGLFVPRGLFARSSVRHWLSRQVIGDAVAHDFGAAVSVTPHLDPEIGAGQVGVQDFG